MITATWKSANFYFIYHPVLLAKFCSDCIIYKSNSPIVYGYPCLLSDPLSQSGTYFTRHQAPRVKPLSLSCWHRLQKDVLKSWCWAFWLRLASWRCFNGFRVSSISYSTSLACLITDWIRLSWKKSAVVQAIGAKTAASFRPFYFSQYGGWSGLCFPKLLVSIKDNHSYTYGKWHQFLFPISYKFPDLNFVPYVPCIFWYKTSILANTEPGLYYLCSWRLNRGEIVFHLWFLSEDCLYPQTSLMIPSWGLLNRKMAE